MSLTTQKLLAIAALILAVLSLLAGGFPFLTAACICLAVAWLI